MSSSRAVDVTACGCARRKSSERIRLERMRISMMETHQLILIFIIINYLSILRVAPALPVQEMIRNETIQYTRSIRVIGSQPINPNHETR